MTVTVIFEDWETHDRVGTWRVASHWVPKGEQVWFNSVRYEVVRVEHTHAQQVCCFVRVIR